MFAFSIYAGHADIPRVRTLESAIGSDGCVKQRYVFNTSESKGEHNTIICYINSGVIRPFHVFSTFDLDKTP